MQVPSEYACKNGCDAPWGFAISCVRLLSDNPPKVMRVLITGSRDWWDTEYIHSVLDEYLDACNVTLISGHCPTGADIICENYAAFRGWDLELYPADWDKYGSRAGFVRNYEMVQTGADVCLAFIRNRSKGATMTAELAQNSGIETRVFHNADFNDGFKSTMELINRRRRQMHVHSILYYHFDSPIIDDATFDRWAKELVELQKKYPKSVEEGYRPDLFADWTGETGYHLPWDGVEQTAVKLLKTIPSREEQRIYDTL